MYGSVKRVAKLPDTNVILHKHGGKRAKQINVHLILSSFRID